MKKLIFTLSIFSLYYSACVTPCEYLVEIPFTIEGSDTISVGDTLWISSTLPLAFNDLNSDIQIPREEVIDMVTEIMIRNLDSMELNVGNNQGFVTVEHDLELKTYQSDNGEEWSIVLLNT